MGGEEGEEWRGRVDGREGGKYAGGGGGGGGKDVYICETVLAGEEGEGYGVVLLQRVL